MNTQYLIDQCIQMEHSLTSFGFTAVDAEFTLNWSSYSPVRLKLSYYAGNEYEQETFSLSETPVYDEQVQDLIGRAWNYIRGLPSVEERRKELFLQSLGRLIDEGREIGLEVDFLNPLEESMRRLSENVITKQ